MIAPVVLLAYYCLLIIAASVVGGMIPHWIRLTHRGMQIALSFVAAMMLGVGMLHMLPHALGAALQSSPASTEGAISAVLTWMVAGCIAMFFIERFFCFHHHDVETDSVGEVHERHEGCHHGHGHDVTWGGAALGLTLHSLLEGVALAVSLQHGHGGQLAGLGVFLVIFLHKPFDSMTIAMLMAHGGWSPRARLMVNGLFATAIPVGAALAYSELARGEQSGLLAAYALAFSAGTFLCISLSDLLPELQFHDHDRVKLSAALLLGLALAVGVGRWESLAHQHETPVSGPLTDRPEAEPGER